MTDWNPPGPGPWQQDAAHNPTSQSLIMQEVYAPGFNRGFTETFSRYGLLLDRLAMGVVNGFTYHQPQPFDMPGPDGPMSPDALHAEFGRRLGVAAAMFESKLWQQDLADWDNQWKPNAIARHRQLSDVSLSDLDDAALGEHLATAAAHVSAMVYQHHRFNMAAILPVGDFALHVSGWTGRPPHMLLNALAGYSQVSSGLPDEMRSAVDAINASSEATAIVMGDGDAGDRLAALRAAQPAVDEYIRSVDTRVIEGFDIVNPTLREQPAMILGNSPVGWQPTPTRRVRRPTRSPRRCDRRSPKNIATCSTSYSVRPETTTGSETSAESTARSQRSGSSAWRCSRSVAGRVRRASSTNQITSSMGRWKRWRRSCRAAMCRRSDCSNRRNAVAPSPPREHPGISAHPHHHTQPTSFPRRWHG